MFTQYKDHLTWQQTVGHEVKDRYSFRSKNDKKMYNIDDQEQYLKQMDETRMKRFYGKHLHKYMGTTKAELVGNE